ncbi:DUF4956 domain-containing protein [Oscillospiraceae bacterium HV4-5-C5C]|nr:DUF4956 domain-containing protein [Oscillospiraceae bacterium HV4-5-C5C]
MLDQLLTSLYSSSSDLTVSSFLISLLTGLVLGGLLAAVYTYKTAYTKSFVVTLALLPAIVSIIIMMVSGSLGAGVAVAGTFSLVRFRSAPGTAREIGAIFLAMAVGLACGMGYPGFAFLFTIIMAAVSLIYVRLPLWDRSPSALQRQLQITVPEDLNYTGAFDDLFAKYTQSAKLTAVKTSSLGSLNKLTYDVTLLTAQSEKEFMDELRCRNGNLEIGLSLPATDSGVL